MNRKAKKYILSIFWIIFIFFTISIYTYQFVNPHPSTSSFINYVITLFGICVLTLLIIYVFNRFKKKFPPEYPVEMNELYIKATKKPICPVCRFTIDPVETFCHNCGNRLKG